MNVEQLKHKPAEYKGHTICDVCDIILCDLNRDRECEGKPIRQARAYIDGNLKTPLRTPKSDPLTEAKIHIANLLGFLDEDPCRFDHNGNCQTHACFGYDGGCDVADAVAWLERNN